jgi:NAD(P)-dependent dehydrogenase (short-subunit alcohol dehydrogenase family)
MTQPSEVNLSARLASKVAVITGGASGLGRASAIRMLAEGARVVLADLNADLLHKTRAEIDPSGERVRVYPLDVVDPAAVDRVFGAIDADHSRIDILVTCAGVSHQASILDNPMEAWQRVIGINLTGTYLCVQAAARRMVPRRSGRIVTIASISGHHVWSGRVAYSSSKAGVVGLTKASAIDLAPHGITVNAVSPGPIATPQTDQLHGPIIREAVVNATPMARYGRADEVADVVAFLASDDARFVTGHELIIDGGLTSAAILYDLAKNPQMR